MGWQLVPSTGTWWSDGDNGRNRALQQKLASGNLYRQHNPQYNFQYTTPRPPVAVVSVRLLRVVFVVFIVDTGGRRWVRSTFVLCPTVFPCLCRARICPLRPPS
jgi:hypothetical protein